MSEGRARSDEVMLPESMMKNPAELRRWVARAFETALSLPPKEAKPSESRRANQDGADEDPSREKERREKTETGDLRAKRRPGVTAPADLSGTHSLR